MDKKIMKNSYRTKSYQAVLVISASMMGLFLMTGCASTPAPTEQMAVTKAEIDNALRSGSNESAPLELKSAMEKMNAAERAMADKDYAHARQLAEQAELDAKLASVRARSTKAQKAADALQEDSRVLRQEIERQTQ